MIVGKYIADTKQSIFLLLEELYCEDFGSVQGATNNISLCAVVHKMTIQNVISCHFMCLTTVLLYCLVLDKRVYLDLARLVH